MAPILALSNPYAPRYQLDGHVARYHRLPCAPSHARLHLIPCPAPCRSMARSTRYNGIEPPFCTCPHYRPIRHLSPSRPCHAPSHRRPWPIPITLTSTSWLPLAGPRPRTPVLRARRGDPCAAPAPYRMRGSLPISPASHRTRAPIMRLPTGLPSRSPIPPAHATAPRPPAYPIKHFSDCRDIRIALCGSTPRACDPAAEAGGISL